MAKTQKTILVDDLDGSTADQSIRFSLDDVEYEIDLTDANAKMLRDDFGKYIAVAQRVVRSRGRRNSGGSGIAREKLQAIRKWATQNGYEVPARGRIKADIIAAYDRAH